MPTMLSDDELADLRAELFTYTVKVMRRGGTVVSASRAVHIEWPDPAEIVRPDGPRVAAVLTDVPDADYRQGDVVEVLAVDGDTTALPAPTRYTVGLVQRTSEPWRSTKVQLAGTDRPGAQ